MLRKLLASCSDAIAKTLGTMRPGQDSNRMRQTLKKWHILKTVAIQVATLRLIPIFKLSLMIGHVLASDRDGRS